MRVEGPVFLKFALLGKSSFRMGHVALANCSFIQDQNKKLAFKIRVLSQTLWEKTGSARLVMTISTLTLLSAFKILARDRKSLKSMGNVLINVQACIFIMKL